MMGSKGRGKGGDRDGLINLDFFLEEEGFEGIWRSIRVFYPPNPSFVIPPNWGNLEGNER